MLRFFLCILIIPWRDYSDNFHSISLGFLNILILTKQILCEMNRYTWRRTIQYWRMEWNWKPNTERIKICMSNGMFGWNVSGYFWTKESMSQSENFRSILKSFSACLTGALNLASRCFHNSMRSWSCSCPKQKKIYQEDLMMTITC